MLSKAAKVLPYEAGVDKTKLSTISYSITSTIRGKEGQADVTTKTKVNLPELPMNCSDAVFLFFMQEFKKAQKKLHWTTGPQLFETFEDHLSGSTLLAWQRIANKQSSKTVATFQAATKELTAQRFPEDAYEEHKKFLRALKKPIDKTPKEHREALESHNSLLDQLPGAPDNDAGLTDQELCRIYHDSMPSKWRTNYGNAGRKAYNDNLGAMQSYFQTQYEMDPPPKKSNGSRFKKKNHSNNNRNQRNGRSNQKPNEDEQCPLPGHGNHLWRECSHRERGWVDEYGNRTNNNNGGNNGGGSNRGSNRNNRNNRNQRNNNRNNNGGNNNRNNNADAHAQSTSDSGTNGNSSGNNSNNNGNNGNEQADGHVIELAEPTSIDDHLDNDAESFLLVSEEPDDSNRGNGERVAEMMTETPSVDATTDMAPITLTVAKHIAGKDGRYLLKTLFDSGSTKKAMINRRALPSDAVIQRLDSSITIDTTQGQMQTIEVVTIKQLYLPEFSNSCYVGTIGDTLVFDSPNIRYDLILGRAFLRELGMDLNFKHNKVTWPDFGEIPFHPPTFFNDNSTMTTLLSAPPISVQRAIDSHANTTAVLKPADYHQVNVREVCDQQIHLTPQQRDELYAVLQPFESTLFSGRIGTYPDRQFHIELEDDAVPFYLPRPYAIPAHNKDIVKLELDRQEGEQIISKCFEPTEWAMGFFAIPKANGQIRTIHDFRPLNKYVKRRRYAVPTIDGIIRRQRQHRFASLIDVSMQYYTFELDEASRNLCVFITPWGKYRFNRLPMGFVMSADWAQSTMERCFQHILHKIEIYMDDIFRSDMEWNVHLSTIREILTILDENGFTVNPSKCTWAKLRVPFVGFIMGPNGPEPWIKRVEPILNMAEPTSLKQLRAFNAMVSFYRIFWEKRAHVMAPLTDITKCAPKQFKNYWTDKQSKAFETIKAIVAKEVLLSYPDPNLPFHIFTDASDLQLGAVIKQDDKPVAFFSRKLSKPQQKYSTIEKELLSILEVLEEYRELLWGNEIIVHCDHKNLTSATSTFRSQRVQNWRLLVEDFQPKLVYIKGEENIEADTLSRHPILELPDDSLLAATNDELSNQLADSFLNLPNLDYPLSFEIIRQAQQADAQLLLQLNEDDPKYTTQNFGGELLICYRTQQNQDFRIYLPEALVPATIEWYHEMLGHSGMTRLARTLKTNFYFPNLDARVNNYVSTCDSCQRYKDPGPGHGHLPERNHTALPFEEVAVDLVGPWAVNIPNVGALEFKLMHVVDTCTCLSELRRITAQTSQEAAHAFNQMWLSRYPTPVNVIHDRGGEFTGPEFQTLLATNNIQPRPITVRNPQANAICERIHHTMGDMIRVTVNEQGNPANLPDAIDLVDNIIARIQRALRTTIHRTLQISPGAFVFHRDMMLNIPLVVNLQAIQNRRQATIDTNAERENRRRIFRDYSPQDRVLLLTTRDRKSDPRAIGPFNVTQVHVNGTLTIQRLPNIFQRVNIRQVKPYNARD